MRNARLISAVCALSLTAALTAVPALAAESAAEEAMSAAESIAEDPEIAERPVYEFTDYVTLGEYKGLSVSVAPVSISDEEVDAEIETRIQLSDEGSDTLEEISYTHIKLILLVKCFLKGKRVKAVVICYRQV